MALFATRLLITLPSRSVDDQRVYGIIEQTHEGQSAAEIADRALVSEPTARRHCKTLVNTGFAETEQDGQTTL